MERSIACSLILFDAAQNRETKKQGLVEDVIANYAYLVLANYQDALETAESMDQAIANSAAHAKLSKKDLSVPDYFTKRPKLSQYEGAHTFLPSSRHPSQSPPACSRGSSPRELLAAPQGVDRQRI